MNLLKSSKHLRKYRTTWTYKCVAQTSALELRGDWLDRAGFEPGTKVSIQVKRNKLIIRAIL